MGTLVCPLCCDEEFSSQLALKYHLLSITDNMYCPDCGKRFDSILQLANHLDGTCGKSNINETDESDEHVEKKENHEETKLIDKEALEPIQEISDMAVEEPNDHGPSSPKAPLELKVDVDSNAIIIQPNDSKDSSENIVVENEDLEQCEDPKFHEDFRDIEQLAVREECKDIASNILEPQNAASCTLDTENAVRGILQPESATGDLLEPESAASSMSEPENTTGDILESQNFPRRMSQNEVSCVLESQSAVSNMLESLKADVEETPVVTEQYSCSTCGVTFSSIVEHIQSYHTGQEVVIDVPGADNEVLNKLVALPEKRNSSVSVKNAKTIMPTNMRKKSNTLEISVKNHKERYEPYMKHQIIRPFSLFKEKRRKTRNELKQTAHYEPKKIFKPVENSEIKCISKEVKIGKFWENQPAQKKVSGSLNVEKIGMKTDVKKLPLKNDTRTSLEKLFGGNFVLKNSEGRGSRPDPYQGVNRIPEVKFIISPDHKVVSDAISMYVCTTCQKEFGSMSAFGRHSCIASKGSLLSCKICNIEFMSTEYMQSHMQDVHGITFQSLGHSVKCDSCNVKFASARAVKQHERVHKPKSLNCTVCHILCPNTRSLNEHMKRHSSRLNIKKVAGHNEESDTRTGNENFPTLLLCKICCKTFSNNKDMKAHWQEHTSMVDHTRKENLLEQTVDSPKEYEGEKMQIIINTEPSTQNPREIDKSSIDVSSTNCAWLPM